MAKNLRLAACEHVVAELRPALQPGGACLHLGQSRQAGAQRVRLRRGLLLARCVRRQQQPRAQLHQPGRAITTQSAFWPSGVAAGACAANSSDRGIWTEGVPQQRSSGRNVKSLPIPPPFWSAIFTQYYAMQSCTSGRNAFFTGMYPLRTGMIPPQLPGSPTYLKLGTPALAKFLLDVGYNTGEFGKNHLGDHTDSLPTAHGFQEFWGYLYHLDAMEQVSFPDINKSETTQGIAPPCKNTPVPGLSDPPGAVDPATTVCLTPPRPIIACDHCVQVFRRHGQEPDLQG